MKIKTLYTRRTLAFFLTVFTALTFFPKQALAQSELSTSEIPTQIRFDDNFIWYQNKIPNVGGFISFTLNGGDGGRRVVSGLCSRKGGQGATVQATFSIGPGDGQLAPGGVIRFIPGDRGQSRSSSNAEGGGGGGGSGLLYTNYSGSFSDLPTIPSLDLADADNSWVLLAVAGGGGGAYLSGICDGSSGRGGNDGEDGGNGVAGGCSGGRDGALGSAGFCGAPGAGYKPNTCSNCVGGKGGGVNGGEGGTGLDTDLVNQDGGFGYGGGGNGDRGGGGGGGFSGGGGGSFQGGGGGGSFVNAAATSSSKAAGSRTNNPRSGFIEYLLDDPNAPVAVCKEANVELDANGMATVLPIDADGGSYDPNGDDAALQRAFFGFNGFGYSVVNTLDFDCSDIGLIANTLLFLRVTDEEGSQGYCSVSLNIEDNSPPTALCQPSLTLIPDETGSIAISPMDLNNGSSDNCGDLSFTASQTTFFCEEPGTYEVTLSVADVADNVGTCTTAVEVLRYTKECPEDFCVNIPQGQTQVYIDIPEPGGELGCGITLDSRICPDGICTNIPYTTNDLSGLYSSGEYRLQWRYRQGSSTTDICISNISVRLMEPFTCAPDFVVEIPDNTCEAFVEIPAPISDIPCGFTVSSSIGGPYSMDDKSGLYSPGDYTVSWRLEEDNNVSDVCTTNFSVQDDESLNARCKNITIDLDANGSATISVDAIDNGSTGVCGLANRSLSRSTFSCSDVGNNSITLTIEDNNGGMTSCMASVTVRDRMRPRALCPPTSPVVQLDENGLGTLLADALAGFSEDNCEIQSETSPPVDYTCADLGPQQVELTVVDEHGLQDKKMCEVIVQEATPPQAKCKNITVQLQANGRVSITSAMVDNGSSNACGGLSLSLDQSTFSCEEEGQNTVTLTVRNQANQTTSCTAIVTVENNIPPTAKCQRVSTRFSEEGVATISPQEVNNGSVDVCGLPIEEDQLALDKTTFLASDGNELQTVTLTVTDVRGKSDECTTTVYLIDNEAPVASCLSSLTVYLDDTGTYELFAEELDNGSTDNTGILNFFFRGTEMNENGNFVEVNLPSIIYTCDQVGNNFAFAKVIDGNENEDNCAGIITITVLDEVAPAAFCKDVELTLDETGEASLTASEVDNGSTDACGIKSLALSQTDFNCSEVGANTVTLTVTDNNDNENTCTATVTVTDDRKPTVVCPASPIMLVLDGDGAATLVANALAVGPSTDNCAIGSETSPTMSFNCGDVGTQQVELTVTDINGNNDSKMCAVLIADNTNPTAICPETSIVIQLDENGASTLAENALAKSLSTDNCGIGGETSPEVLFDCDDVGTQQVQLTVSDVNGNSDSKMCAVLVVDNTNPTAICPETSLVVQLNQTGVGTLAENALAEGLSTDNCGVLSETSPELNFVCADVGTQQVLLTVEDLSGNIDRALCFVEVEDNVAPTVACQNATVQLDADGLGGILPAAIDDGSTDICGIRNRNLSRSIFSCSEAGVNTVTLTVTDNNGNSNSCTATVTVVDNINPVAICPATPPTVVLDANGMGSLAANALAGNSTDNCSVLSETSPQTDFTCADLGSKTVVLTARDGSGNEDTENCTVNIVDNINPVAICPATPPTVVLDANGMGSLAANALASNSTDNCSVLSETSPQTDFTCADLGSKTVVLTARDGSSNEDTENCSVNIVDNIAPMARCQEATVVLSPTTGEASLSPSGIDGSSTDNCSIMTYLVDGQASIDYSCADIGPQRVTLKVIDQANLEHTCIATVKVLASDFCPDPEITNEGGPSIADPCTCSATPGYFNEEVVVTSINPNEGWRLQTVEGLVNPNNFPNEFSPGDLFEDNGDGTYSLIGMHASGVGYSLVAVSDLYPDDPLPISNLCYLPELTTVDTSLCSNEATGIVLELAPNTVTVDEYEITGLDLGAAVQIAGGAIAVGTTFPNADYLADVAFEYSEAGINTVQITVVPTSPDGCDGDPLVIDIDIEFCPVSCSDDIKVNLKSDCTFDLAVNNVATGKDLPPGQRIGYSVVVNDGDFSGDRSVINGVGRFEYGIFNRQNELVCWGNVTAEDKTAPTVEVPGPVALECFLIGQVLNQEASALDADGETETNTQDVAKNYLGYVEVTDCSTYDIQWADNIEYFNCPTRMTSKEGRRDYAKITRRWTVTDQFGKATTKVQIINFFEPDFDENNAAMTAGDALPTSPANEFAWRAEDDFAFDTKANKWVLTVNACDPLNADVPNIYPSLTDKFGDKQYLNGQVCNYSINEDATRFPDICGDGYKEERTIQVYDWCEGGVIATYNYLVKVGDFAAPIFDDCILIDDELIDFDGYSLSRPQMIIDDLNDGNITPGAVSTSPAVCIIDISTGPMDCTASINSSLAALRSLFGTDLVNDACGDPSITTEVLSFGSELIGGFPTGRDVWTIGGYLRQGPMIVGLPLGYHALVISASDDCYNDALGIVFFQVVDKVKPIMKCDDELRVTLVEGDEKLGIKGYALVTYADVDEGSWDNCSLEKLEVRRLIDNSDAAADWEAKNADDLDNYYKGTDENGIYTPWGDIVEFFCADVDSLVKIELRGTDNGKEIGAEENNQSICWLNVDVENGLNYRVDLEPTTKTTITCEEAVTQENVMDFVTINQWGMQCDGPDVGVRIEADLDQCGVGEYLIYLDVTGGIDTKNANNIDPDPVKVTVAAVHRYWVKFPADAELDCFEVENYDPVETSADEDVACDLLATYTDTPERFAATQNGDACYKLFVTYKVINWCEYDGESLPVIVSRDWDNHNGYKCDDGYNLNPIEPDGDDDPGSEDIYVIVDVDDAAGTGIVYYDNDSDPSEDNNSTDGLKDDDDDLEEDYWWAVDIAGTCAPSTWYDDDDGNFNNPNDPGFDIDGTDNQDDSDNRYGSHGYWQYTQHILVYDDTPPTVTAEIEIDNGGALDNEFCDAGAELTITIEDECSVDDLVIQVLNAAGAQAVKLTATINADGTASAAWDTPDLPIDTYKWTVRVNDGCGNITDTPVEFEVVDVKAPAPICHEDLVVELMPTDASGSAGSTDPFAGMAAVWASDFIASDIGDCTGQGPGETTLDGRVDNTRPTISKEAYSIYRDADFTDSTYVSPYDDETVRGLIVTCDDLDVNGGMVMVRVYAEDRSENADYCLTLIQVQDNNGACGTPAVGLIAGAISTEEVRPVEGVEVRLSGGSSQLYMTKVNGEFGFENIEEGHDYSVTPQKDTEAKNGVSTFDLILIQKHILGPQLLDSPYKLIAADVNNSKSVSTLDLIQLRKLILNIDTEFANNTSWRFVEADYRFANPSNPWMNGFPEVKNINNLDRADYASFVAVKIGDVNGSALIEARSATGQVHLQTAEQRLEAGNEYRVSFQADRDDLAGYQLTMQLQDIELVDIIYGAAKAEHFGVFTDEGVLTTSFNGAITGELFSLVIRATADLNLSDALSVNSRYTAAEAYTDTDADGQHELLDVKLAFTGATAQEAAFSLTQNTPNPFQGETIIGFNLPASSEATLRIQDVTGRTVKLIEGDFAKGYHQVNLKSSDLPSAGVYFYTLTAGDLTATKKMILAEAVNRR